MILNYSGKVKKINAKDINQLRKESDGLEDSTMVVMAFGGANIDAVKNKLNMAYNVILTNTDCDKIVNIGDIPFNAYNYRTNRITKCVFVLKGEALKFFLEVKWDNLHQLILTFAYYQLGVHINTGKKTKYEGDKLIDILTASEKMSLMMMKSKTMILIPSKDIGRLEKCIENIPEDYKYTVIFNDENNIREFCKDKCNQIAYGGSFNYSNIHNNAIECLPEYEYYIFLNDDVILQPDTLDNLLVPIAMDDNVGIVGAKLLYPDGTIQHAGVSLDKKRGALHDLRGRSVDAWEANYFKIDKQVTFALVALNHQVIEMIGKLDENLPYDFNDIDYCIRCGMVVKQVVYNPEAIAVHEESATRKIDDKISQVDDLKYFKAKYKELLK